MAAVDPTSSSAPKGSLKRYSFHSVMGSLPVALAMASGRDQTELSTFSLLTISTLDSGSFVFVSTGSGVAPPPCWPTVIAKRPAARSHEAGATHRTMALSQSTIPKMNLLTDRMLFFLFSLARESTGQALALRTARTFCFHIAHLLRDPFSS